jgi:heme A synthase
MAFDWKATIGTVAPALAGIFGTPVAGVAVSALCKAFGLEPSPENAAKIAQQAQDGTLSGSDWAKIKAAEIDAKLQLEKMNLDYDLAEDKIVASDRDSARNREIQVKDWTPRILAYFLTVGFFGLLYWMMRHEVPGTNKDLLNILVGVLGSAWVQVVSYYFGSSAGSSKKDDTIRATAEASRKN